MKKILLVLCAMLCVVGLFANGGGESEKSGGIEISAPGVYPVVSQPVTKRILVRQQLDNIPDWSTNKASLHMEEVTGVHIEYDVAPDFDQARTLAIASDDLPDAIMGETPPHEVIKYAAQGVFIPLNDLIEEYTVNIKKVMMEDPDLADSSTTPDGNIYGLPQLNDDHHGKYGQKIWINMEWLDNLGLEMPETTEDFYNVLVAFRDKDPNGNGKRDEVPLSTSTDAWLGGIPGNILNAFLYVNFQMKGLYLDNGKVMNAFNDPRYREGLKYTNMLYEEKLIDPAAFTQDGKQLKQLAENPEANLLGAASAAFWRVFAVDGGDSERHKVYRTMNALMGPEGVQYSAYYKYKTNRDRFLITDACEQPEILIKWADYLVSPPGAYNVCYGPEGEGWRKPDPGQLGVNGLPANSSVSLQI
jgi:putative aldouronate transport system substrate-binding protein